MPKYAEANLMMLKIHIAIFRRQNEYMNMVLSLSSCKPYIGNTLYISCVMKFQGEMNCWRNSH